MASLNLVIRAGSGGEREFVQRRGDGQPGELLRSDTARPPRDEDSSHEGFRVPADQRRQGLCRGFHRRDPGSSGHTPETGQPQAEADLGGLRVGDRVAVLRIPSGRRHGVPEQILTDNGKVFTGGSATTTQRPHQSLD